MIKAIINSLFCIIILTALCASTSLAIYHERALSEMCKLERLDYFMEGFVLTRFEKIERYIAIAKTSYERTEAKSCSWYE